jgi:hypothetical protein
MSYSAFPELKSTKLNGIWKSNGMKSPGMTIESDPNESIPDDDDNFTILNTLIGLENTESDPPTLSVFNKKKSIIIKV